MLKFIFYLLLMTPLCFLNFWYIYIYGLFFFFFFFFFCYFKFDYFFSISYGFGIDKYSFIFICLTLIICLLMVYSMMSYSNFGYSNFLFYLNLLVFSLFMLFVVTEFFMFYFFFEVSLLPVMFIIFGWGYQPERLKAGFFLILYTIFASFPFLLSIFYISNLEGCFNFFFSSVIYNNYIVFFLLFSFLVKFPIFGLHIWLPSAHVEAPVSGSMILAGLMLKLGGYGFIRSYGFIYDFLVNYGYIFISFSLLGCLLVSMICLIQSDLKMLIAYSSVCHMSVVISGLFSLNVWCLFGSLMFMMGHGFVSSGLFYLVGLLYTRLGSRSFFILSGLLSICPSLTFFWFMFCISNMSCPPSISLFSEIFLVIGLLSWSFFTIYFFFFILFLSACYSLMIFSLSQHGSSSNLLSMFSLIYLSEYFVLFMHLFPVFLIVFNINFFFLFI